jgi:hypothetical protein
MAIATLAALAVAFKFGVHKAGVDGLTTTVWAAGRVLAAALLLFGACGFGVTRILLPAALRRHEVLWVLPVGACTSTLALTALGYARVPFWVALPLVIAGGLALSVHAVRARGTGRPWPRELVWPAYLGALLACVALIPFFAAGFATVIGTGSDAHLAAGTGELLRHKSPTGTDVPAPVDRMPVLWRSKPPIYYGLAAVATLSGLETWEALTPLVTLMFALAAIGFFVLVRDLLGAGLGTALAAMAVTGLDRMVVHTVSVPYYNQTWGYFTLPFALVLGWYAVHERSRPAWALVALFLGLGAFAYPLALPIPLLAIAVFFALSLRERGGRIASPSVLRERRSLLWAVPLGLLLAIPVLGVLEKSITAAKAVLPGESLRNWGGDLLGFFPAHQFFALPSDKLWWLAVGTMLVLAGMALANVARPLAFGLAGVIIAFLLIAVYFRQRDYGWYFEFKALAFVAPLVLACACAGTERLRRGGPAVLAVLCVAAALSGRQETMKTGYFLTREIVGLRDWAKDLPPGASVRLDMRPAEQLWAGYMLAARPTCSTIPLLGTAYPHVPYSRDAGYVLATREVERFFHGPPPDSAGRPVRRNATFRLYRMRRGIPGPDRCSQRSVETVTKVGF